ncbi:carboxyltransferase domain-containing protein [Brevibacillus fluminis]|uniref:Carboxyltransferase domain-containing protein n=1 Tax=Brevibacillus fluminis TaxID=511487 RepID=A0A3M8DGE6_9BACL|nr:carboxyltransferase domain-containing protein [Brevibacillus fluminis]RNB87114.1 carboxyltransferase domain-containing protein [Brevibacillus fluminis]
MFTLPETRFDFAGDEYIYAEISREMGLASNFKALAITNELRKRNIPGLIDICPANASYLVRFNPEIISSQDLLDYLIEIDITKSNVAELNLSTRIVEIPTWYDDPITRSYSERFASRHQHPGLSDFDFVMKCNGFTDKAAFIQAHSSTPYFITMVGYIPGTSWEFPLGTTNEEILQAPKYLSPRSKTPNRAIGLGGAFNAIYPVDSPGSYQLIGMSAVPVYDKERRYPELCDYVLAKPGDIWRHRPIDEAEYWQIVADVEKGTYTYRTRDVEFSPKEYLLRGKAYIALLMEGF